MFTVTFYIVSIVVLVAIAALAAGLAFAYEGKTLGAFGSCIAVGAAVLIVLSVIFGLVQADKNGKDNCTNNLHGKVTTAGCIVGTDWKIIPNF